MRFAFVLLSFLYCVLIFLSCEQTTYSHIIPSPTEKTAVHKNGEDGESYEAHMNWIELMHGGRESGGKSIESENKMK